jgi:short-subunit dehydrogenase
MEGAGALSRAQAGASMSALAAEVRPGVTDALFGVNTLGPIKLTAAVLPAMLARRKGRLVVVASMAARVPSPGQCVYSGG